MQIGKTIAGVCLVACGTLSAEPPATIDLKALQAEIVNDVVVPVPQEIFASLDKLGNQNWKGELKKSGYERLGKRSQIALLFGVVVADGFVAVQAGDKEEVEKIGRHVLRLSKSLGVSQTVTSHAQAIIEAAKVDDWRRIRLELDKVQAGVSEKMEAMRDEELAKLIAIGGWVRGTEALSSILSKSYSREGADILNQPDLVAHLDGQLRDLPLLVRNTGPVRKVRKGIRNLKPLLKIGADGTVPEASVRKVHEITASLVKSIINNS